MLVIKNLHKSFKVSSSRSSLILKDINYSFNDKGLYFIIGKSGSGKTTLLNVLSCLMKADSGEVIFNDKNILLYKKNERVDYIKNDISILFQKYNLLDDLSVLDNLIIALSIKNMEIDNRVDELLKKYGLYEKRNQLVGTLSGGEKQRVALIRAIIARPKILFCDEPTGALDYENSLLLMKELKELSKEILVIVVTHNMELFSLFYDGFLYLENGEIKEFSSPNLGKDNKTSKDISNHKNNKNDNLFINKISTKNIKNNFKRNIISTISAAFSIIVLILSIFLNRGISSCKNDLIKSYADNNSYNVSLVKSESIDNSPIELEKSIRPNYNDLNELFNGINCYIDFSYDYFFSGQKEIKFNKLSIDKFSCRPYANLVYPNNYLLINSNLANMLNEKELLNKEISLFVKCDYSYISERNNTTIIDTFEVEIPFIIGQINNEFNYMNQPCAYYSTFYFEKVLKNTIALNSSLDLNKNTTFYDLVTISKDESEISSYSYKVFAFDDKSNKKIQNLMSSKTTKNTNLKIENYGFTLVNSFISLSESVFLGINIFIILLALTALFIIGFLAYSSVTMSRKEIAIVSIIGAKDNSILNIYIIEQFVYSINGLIIGILFSLLLKSILNRILKSFFIVNNLINFDGLVITIIILTSIIFVYLANLIPLRFVKLNSIAEELKEE